MNTIRRNEHAFGYLSEQGKWWTRHSKYIDDIKAAPPMLTAEEKGKAEAEYAELWWKLCEVKATLGGWCAVEDNDIPMHKDQFLWRFTNFEYQPSNGMVFMVAKSDTPNGAVTYLCIVSNDEWEEIKKDCVDVTDEEEER